MKVLLAGGVFLALAMSPKALARPALSVSPPGLRLVVGAGGEAEGRIAVRNDGDEVLEVGVSLPASARYGLSVHPPQARLGPGEVASFRLSLIPEQPKILSLLRPPRRGEAILYVEARPDQRREREEISASVILRVAVPVRFAPPSLAPLLTPPPELRFGFSSLLLLAGILLLRSPSPYVGRHRQKGAYRGRHRRRGSYVGRHRNAAPSTSRPPVPGDQSGQPSPMPSGILAATGRMPKARGTAFSRTKR